MGTQKKMEGEAKRKTKPASPNKRRRNELPVEASPADAPHIRVNLLPLYNAIGHLTRRLDQKVSLQFEHDIGGGNLTRTQFALLIVAALAPGCEQAEIGKLASYDAATTGVVINRLEAKGLIARTRSPRSRRGWVVSATAEGQAWVNAWLPKLSNVEVEMLAPLSPDERLTLLRLLSKLLGINNSYNVIVN